MRDLKKLLLVLLLGVSLFAVGCGGGDSGNKFEGQPAPDPNRDNGPPPPRGINNPEVEKMRKEKGLD
jgi:hypothetical protein